MKFVCMGNELTAAKKKEWAQMLYLQNQLTQKQIAEKVGAREATISRWVTKENWEKLRKSLLTTKSELLSFLYDVLSKLKDKINSGDGIGDSKDADKFVKYTAAIKSLETETSVAELMEAGRMFHKWMQAVDPQMALTFLNNYDAFIKDNLKRF
jgi:hypothetical protein